MTATLRFGDMQAPLHRARLGLEEEPRARSWRGRADPSPEPPLDRQIRIEGPDGSLAGAFRLRCVDDAGALADSRLGALWDLAPLAARPGRIVEFGELRMRPEAAMADVLRAAWGAVAAVAQRRGAGLILGACAFPGADPALHLQALALLRGDHVAPMEWAPPARAPGAVALASLGRKPDRIAAVSGLPPLLRSWLGLGAWVASQAILDPEADIIEVLAILDPARIPPARSRALVAAQPLA